MAEASSETRRSRRARWIRFAVVEGAETILARGVDSTRLGVGLIMTRPIPVDKRVKVTLQSAEGEPTVVSGTVRHCQPASPDGFRVGIEFDEAIEDVTDEGSAVAEEGEQQCRI